MNQKLQLPTVTLIAVAGNKQAETIASLYKSMSKVDFGAVKMLTNIDISASGIEIINVGGLKTWAEYNEFIIRELYKYFDTDYCLICQHDSWVLNADCWDDKFFDFDLLGARGLSDGRPNYNGGFSLRSKRFQEAIAKDEAIEFTAPEDECLTRLYRAYLEKKYDFKYCTDEVADRFAYELHEPTQKTFGFHAYHYQPYKEVVLIKRNNSLGDVIMLEPVLHWYHQQGYRVALETMPEFMRIYFQHYFPVIPKNDLNPKIVPFKVIDLNFAYEIKPKQPVLQSYYEMAGITNGIMRNSKLNVYAGAGDKMFQKYCLIHNDETGMEYRNSHGVNWEEVVKFLEKKGFLVFQIGRNVKEVSAPHMNTLNLEFMLFLIKGASLLIGLDSGCAQVAVGLDVPSVIMFGSVDAKLRYSDFTKIRVVQSECPKLETKHCYHSKVDVVGTDCVYNKEMPPCSTYTSEQLITAIKELI